jgi:hypothetical protein
MLDDIRHPKYLDPRWTPVTSRFYCGHCIDPTDSGTGWLSQASAAHHIQSDHDVFKDDQVDGLDILTGEELMRALERRRSHEADAIAKFRRALDSMIGADDFLTDCGA